MQVDEERLLLINISLNKIVHKLTLPIALQTILQILSSFYPDDDLDTIYDRVYFKANPSLAFPKSDIESIVFSEQNDMIHVEVMLNFLSIFGVTSPLPIHYNERVLDDAAKDKILLDFLDMLNHRLKRLIYPIWKRQRYYIQYQKDLKDNFSKYILSILGLYGQVDNINNTLDLHRILPFSGILCMHQKSTASLLSILKHYFQHDAIFVEEGVMSKSKLPQEQYVRLGEQNSSFGLDMSIGTFLLTRNLKFRIIFDQIKWEELAAFSFGGEKQRQLADLMKLVQRAPLEYDIVVTLAKEEIQPCILGDNVRLGVNGWIGSVDGIESIVVSKSA